MTLTHWNYYLAIESDLENLTRYIEFHPDNFATYSIENAKLLMTATSHRARPVGWIKYFVLGLCLCACSQPPALDVPLHALIDPLRQEGIITDMVIGVWRDGVENFYTFGAARDTTIVEIGSLTKPLTALALVRMAEQDLLSLDDPLQKYLPATLQVPRHQEGEITLRHLATHTAGLPRIPTNLAPHSWADPYADYTEASLAQFLAAAELHTVPGQHYEYSNLGFDLLGLALAQRAHRPFADVIAHWISEPLGLVDTRIQLLDSQQSRVMTGRTADGDSALFWRQPFLQGSGALHSTPRDLLHFVAAQLRPPSALAAAIAQTQQPQFTRECDDEAVTLGWQRNALGELWHNGETGGFSGFMGFSRAHQTGVVVLTNTATPLTTAVGKRMLALLRGDTVAPLTLPHAVSLTNAQLDHFVGRYRRTSDTATDARTITIDRSNDHLMVRTADALPIRLYPINTHQCINRTTFTVTTFIENSTQHVVRMEDDDGETAMKVGE